jgi:DNA invertase Pin-like site-specific DNA recombinase
MFIEQQEAMLRQAMAGEPHEIAAIYRERHLTPRARRDGLPARDRLLADSGQRFDVLLVSDLSCLGRNLSDLVRALAHLKHRGVEVLAVTQSDAAPARADAASLDAARRRYRAEAAAEGRRQARAKGIRFGRPPVSPDRIARVQASLAAGYGIRPTARLAGVSPATVMRIREGVVSAGG